MRISKDPEERRTEILDAAEKLFAEKGYAKTTVNDIISSIGIAKGTFYYYFKSKEDVLKAQVFRILDVTEHAMTAVVNDPSMNAMEKMFVVIAGLDKEKKVELLEEFHKIDNSEMRLMLLKEGMGRFASLVTSIVEQGIDEGVFKTEYPREAVEFLIIYDQIVFVSGIFNWEKEEFRHKTEAFIAIMERLLGAEKGAFGFIYERISSILDQM